MRRLLRLLTIAWVICRYRLDEFAPVTVLPLPLRLLLFFAPWHLFPKLPMSRGERLRKALEKLGPIFVKFGQILSTRRDLLPEDLADELKKLQDKVPPFAGSEAVAIIETALKAPVDEIFASFTKQPMASASVAQVHAAKLNSGEEVVVKVIRPNIENTIRIDIALMLMVAQLVELYWKEGKRLHPVEVVKDYENTIIDELDLQREAANTSQLKRNFINSSLIYIPDIYWDYTTTNVLVMERIYGIPVAEIGQLRDAGVDLKLLAERGVEVFFTQVFRDSFFHADMHPGNIFVDAEKPDNPRYIAIDCGIVGSLDQDDQNYLALNLLAFFNRDYRQVAALHVSSGWVSADTRISQFEAAIRTVCEPIFEKPLKDISFGQFLVRLFETARRFDMEVQPQLVLLQKTLLNIEGLGRQLYPDLDLWSTAHPYLERWMRERIAPPNVLKTFQDKLPQWLAQSPEIPGLLFDAAEQLRHQHQHKEQYQQSLQRVLQTEKRQHRDFFWGTIAVSLALVIVLQKAPVQILQTQDWPVWGLGLLGFYLWARPK